MMKQMLTILAAGFIGLMSPTTSHATVLDFNFSFTGDTTGNVPGTVTGEIFGLTDDATSSASKVILDSYPAGLGLPTPPLPMFSNVLSNSFTVNNGILTAAKYNANVFIGPNLNEIDLVLNDVIGENELRFVAATINNTANTDGFAGVTYTPVPVPAPLLATGPVAATVTLLATGLAALWPLGRRRRRTAPA